MPWYIRRERIMLFIVYRLPNWLIYWCVIRAFSYATTGENSGVLAGEVTAMQVLKCWEGRTKKKPADQQLEMSV